MQLIIRNRSDTDPERDIEHLADTIKRLSALCIKLQRENQQLRSEKKQLISERELIISQTNAAKKRVENMLDKLHALSPQS